MVELVSRDEIQTGNFIHPRPGESSAVLSLDGCPEIARDVQEQRQHGVTQHQREDFRPQSIPDNTQSEEKDIEADVQNEEDDRNEEEARESVRELMQKDRDDSRTHRR
jgi:hypothetical protein